MRREPAPFVIFTIAPIVFIAFLRPAFENMAYAPLGGSAQVVPGMAVVFSFVLMGTIGVGFFREHGWNTWVRLQTAPASPLRITLGKLVLPLLLLIVQMSTVFAAGGLVFGLSIQGAPWELLAIIVAFAICLVAIGMALVAVAHSILGFNALVYLGAFLLAGFGGALTPTTLLPGWVQAVANATPQHWAMEGFQDVIRGASVATILTKAGILLGFAAVFAAIAAWRFRFDEDKSFFA